jgi:hypothetical protein
VSDIWVGVGPLKDVVTNSDKGLDDDKQRTGNDVEKTGCGLLQVLARHLSLMNEEIQENKFSQNTSVPTVNRTGHFPYTKQKRHCSRQLVRSKIKK